MASEWVPVVSSLGGVALGAGVTWARDTWRERQKVRKEATYLAILVLAHLDKLIDDCVAVAHDDGEEDEHGFYQPKHPTPEFDALSLDVEWKSLPSELMYAVLQVPFKIQQLQQRLRDPGFDDPPEYAEFFWFRRTSFAELGLEILGITNLLMKHLRLPPPSDEEHDLRRKAWLRSQIDRVERAKERYREENANAPLFDLGF